MLSRAGVVVAATVLTSAAARPRSLQPHAREPGGARLVPGRALRIFIHWGVYSVRGAASG